MNYKIKYSVKPYEQAMKELEKENTIKNKKCTKKTNTTYY